MEIKLVTSDKKEFLDLLLLADEQERNSSNILDFINTLSLTCHHTKSFQPVIIKYKTLKNEKLSSDGELSDKRCA